MPSNEWTPITANWDQARVERVEVGVASSAPSIDELISAHYEPAPSTEESLADRLTKMELRVENICSDMAEVLDLMRRTTMSRDREDQMRLNITTLGREIAALKGVQVEAPPPPQPAHIGIGASQQGANLRQTYEPPSFFADPTCDCVVCQNTRSREGT